MTMTRLLIAQENKATSPLLTPTAPLLASGAVHNIPLCRDSTVYLHPIPSSAEPRYLPILKHSSASPVSLINLSTKARPLTLELNSSSVTSPSATP
jgi:hypothetical protein